MAWRGDSHCAFVLLFVVHLGLPPCHADDSLEDRLKPLITAHQGEVAIVVKNLRTGERYAYHDDQPMPTASLIKLAVMVEAYFQAKEGTIRLDDKVTLRTEEKSRERHPHGPFQRRGIIHPAHAIRLMIAFSDNTATNLVLDRIGIKSTADRMEKLGLPNTKIHAKVFKGSTTSAFPERTKEFGLGSTTAAEMVTLLEKLHGGELVSPEACREMIEHLKKCDDKQKSTRFLPDGMVVAHKTGSVSDVRTDAGILYLNPAPSPSAS